MSEKIEMSLPKRVMETKRVPENRNTFATNENK